MKIRYDDKGTILAVGDDGCDWRGSDVLQLAGAPPAELLAGFALGRYGVRDGQVVKAAGRAPARPPVTRLLGRALLAEQLEPALFTAERWRGGTAPPAAADAVHPPGATKIARKRAAAPAKAGRARRARG